MQSDLVKKNLSRHVKLTKEELEIFLDNLKVNHYKKNEYVLQRYEICKYTHFVNEGLLRLFEIDANGFEKNILFAKEEWWVSDLYSFHTQKPGNYFIQALEDTEVLELPKENMEKLFFQIPKLERFWRILHINAFISQQERVKFMMTQTAEERYQDFIKKNPKAELRISQKHIASFLGITPEFLSKMKARLKS